MLSKTYSWLRKGSDFVEKVSKFLSALMLFICFAAVFYQVLNRYVLVKQTLFPWRSASWTDELARFMMIGSAYVAMGMCFKYGMLSRADMIYTRLSRVPKKMLYYFEALLIGIFLYVAIRYGIAFALANKIYRSESLRLPGNILYMIPVVGFSLIGYQFITELVGVIIGEIEPFDSIEGSSKDDSLD